MDKYLQIVWGESKKLGCGSAVGRIAGLSCIFYACHYKAKGNMDGKYADNVKEGEFNADETCISIDQVLHLNSAPKIGAISKPFPDTSTTSDSTNTG